MDNATISQQLTDHAAALEASGQNLYRVQAYRRAASIIKMLPFPVDELVREGGRKALEAIPGIGAHLALTIDHLVRTGEFVTLGPKPEETDPEERLTSLPGIGSRTAARMREELGIEALDEVAQAAED